MMTNAQSTILPKVSYSWKNQYEWCPRQFRYQRIDKVAPDRPKNISMIVGIAIHRVVELMYKKKEFSLEYVRAAWPYVFENTVAREKFIFKSPLNRQRWYDKSLEILDNIYRMAEERGMLVEPVSVEWKFKLEVKSTLGRRFIIRGVIDLILRINGEIWILDLKTGSYVPTAKELDEHAQLTIYSLAAKQILNLDVKKLGFWYPRNKKILWTKRTERDHEKVINEIEKTQFAIEREEFEPTYKRCFMCSFEKRCKGEDAVKKTGVPLGWFYKETKR